LVHWLCRLRLRLRLWLLLLLRYQNVLLKGRPSEATSRVAG